MTQQAKHQLHRQSTPAPQASGLTIMTPPPTPPPVRRPLIHLSSSMSPPPTPNAYDTPNRRRQLSWLQASVVRRSSSAVDEAVDERMEKSKFLLRKRSSSFPAAPLRVEEQPEEEDDNVAGFNRDEIVAGELLGEGTFNCVYEVVGFSLQSSHQGEGTSRVRAELAGCSPTRFALKHLRAELLDDTQQFEQAATDLVMEAKYMAALSHPNILKLHGEPLQGTAAINRGVDGYFLLCDRLSETLAGRIERWNNGEAAETNTVSCKLRYALQIAQALQYLHQQRILFRDLKPSNIGFHQQDKNRIQLFDFGLCRELPPRHQARPYVHGAEVDVDMDMDMEGSYVLEMDESWNEEEEEEDPAATSSTDVEEVYFMSGAGTQIYMAPEVLVQHRYNLKADVYSWSMVTTELLLLEKPLPHYEMDDHVQYVCVEGDRPALEGHPEIPDSCRDLLAWAWEADVSKRCNISQLCEELPEVVAEVEQQQGKARQVMACSGGSWQDRLVQAVGRMQRYVLSVMGLALERVSSFLFRARNNDSNQRRDVTFDLAEDDKKKREEQEPSGTTPEEEEDRSASMSSDCVMISPRPAPRFSRSALLKRKPSSASTTAMTDDEYDDDDLGFPLSPPYYQPAMPLEALIERHNSNASTATTSHLHD